MFLWITLNYPVVADVQVSLRPEQTLAQDWRPTLSQRCGVWAIICGNSPEIADMFSGGYIPEISPSCDQLSVQNPKPRSKHPNNSSARNIIFQFRGHRLLSECFFVWVLWLRSQFFVSYDSVRDVWKLWWRSDDGHCKSLRLFGGGNYKVMRF